MRILIDEGSTRTMPGRTKAAGRARRASEAGGLVVACDPKKGADRECACSGAALADQPEYSAEILDALGVSLLNLGCLDEGARLIEQALRIRRKLYGDDHPVTASSLNSYARVLRERGQLSDAEQTAQVALKINRATYGEQTRPVAITLYELGVIYINQGRYAEAETAAQTGLATLEKLAIDDTDPYTTRLLDARARAESARGAHDAASATYERVLKLDRAQVGVDHMKYVSHLANAAGVKAALGQYKQAEAAYLKAIEFYANRLKRRCHPNLIDMYANLGSMYLRRNSRPDDMRKAARYLDEALRLNLKVRGPMHLLVANDYSNLGRLNYHAENRRGALRSFLEAIKIYERNIRRGSVAAHYIFFAESLTWAGRIFVESGSPSEAEKAEPILERSASMWSANGEAGSIGKAAAEASLGRALHLQGKDPTRARQLLAGALAVLSAALGEDYPFVQTVRVWVDEVGGAAKAA